LAGIIWTMSQPKHGSQQMVDPGTALTVASKILPIAARGVRKLLANAQNQRYMTEILTTALQHAAEECAWADPPTEGEIRSIAAGAVRTARTGSAKQTNAMVGAWRRRPRAIGGRARPGLQTIGPERAVVELALCVQESAKVQAGVLPRARLYQSEEVAELAANKFIEEIIERPDAVNRDFADELSKEWLDAVEHQALGKRWLKWSGYDVLLTGAAALAGVTFGLTAIEVLQVAAAAGITTIIATAGVATFRRESDPDDAQKVEAELRRLLHLINEIVDFIDDLREVDWTEAQLGDPGQPPELPPLLVTLIKNLDATLLPEAKSLSPLLESYLKDISYRLHLLQDGRPSFKLMSLNASVWTLAQWIEGNGYRPAQSITPAPPRLAIERGAQPAPEEPKK